MSEPKDIFMLADSISNEQELVKMDRNRYKANIKYDGVRCMAMKKGEDLILLGRRGSIMNKNFSEVVAELKQIKQDFMIDGEIISLDNDFTKLQSRALTKDAVKIRELEKKIPVKFMAFDVVKYGEVVVMNEPLRARLDYLNRLFKDNIFNHLEVVSYDDIDNMLSIAIESNGEGIVVKDMNAVYESKRSKNWYKYKLFKETTLTITGFTENNKGIRATDKDNNAVQIAGHHAQEVMRAMERNDGEAIINIQYLTQSKEGRYRFPSYRGLANEN